MAAQGEEGARPGSGGEGEERQEEAHSLPELRRQELGVWRDQGAQTKV